MNADLLVQIPEYTSCAVHSREFRLLLMEKGWREIRLGGWTSPNNDDPDVAFARLSMSITPRRGDMIMGGEAAPQGCFPTFQRRLDLGENIWVFS